MTACAHLWVDSGYRHCYICGMRMSDYLDQQSAPEQAPKVGSGTLHFDLKVEVNDDGTATATLSDPGSFDVPIAEQDGASPDEAVAALFAGITLPAPKVGITCNGQPVKPGVISGGSSHFGHYVGKAVVAEALGLGMHDEMAAGAVETYDDWYYRSDWPHFDHWHDMVTEAEEWLNEHTEGGIWMWCDGDFALIATKDCPRCGGPYNADFTGSTTLPGDCMNGHLEW